MQDYARIGLAFFPFYYVTNSYEIVLLPFSPLTCTRVVATYKIKRGGKGNISECDPYFTAVTVWIDSPQASNLILHMTA